MSEELKKALSDAGLDKIVVGPESGFDPNGCSGSCEYSCITSCSEGCSAGCLTGKQGGGS